jgi:hypothetical protein
MNEPDIRQSKPSNEAGFDRNLSLILAFDEPNPVRIENIQIDLKCNLDKTAWRPACPTGIYDNVAALYGPEIAFPWAPPFWKGHITQSCELIEVRSGDEISIDTIKSTRLEAQFGDFDLEEEIEAKLAYLKVKMVDSEI